LEHAGSAPIWPAIRQLLDRLQCDLLIHCARAVSPLKAGTNHRHHAPPRHSDIAGAIDRDRRGRIWHCA